MGETIKHVVKGFPVEKLPEELRRGIASGRMVQVTVEEEVAEAAGPRPLHEMYGFAKGMYASQGLDPTEYIRKLRDEWD